MRVVGLGMAKTGPKESEKTAQAVRLFKKGWPAMKAAFGAGVTVSTLYRALQRRKEKR
jgi:DNA invertase Pin-like site-specific DNA recombinase